MEREGDATKLSFVYPKKSQELSLKFRSEQLHQHKFDFAGLLASFAQGFAKKFRNPFKATTTTTESSGFDDFSSEISDDGTDTWNPADLDNTSDGYEPDISITSDGYQPDHSGIDSELNGYQYSTPRTVSNSYLPPTPSTESNSYLPPTNLPHTTKKPTYLPPASRPTKPDTNYLPSN